MGPANTENQVERDSKRKWRLSNLLSPGHKESKDVPQPEVDSAASGPHDSAYGGSEVNSSAPNSEQNVPTISNSEASAQGATVKTSTDKATGRVITTTTTTTTTTVTTINGDQYQVPAGSDVVVTTDETSTQIPTELSARPLSRELREEEAQQGPPIPTKSHNRRSVSPRRAQSSEPSAPSPLESNRHNFSYPTRTPPPQMQAPPSQQQPPFLGGASAIHNNNSNKPQSGAPQIPHPQFQRDKSPFIPQIPPRYGSATPGQQEQPYQAYHPPNSQHLPAVAQNTSRPRPPVEPSMGQPRVDGTPRNSMAYSGGQQRLDERPSTVQNLKTAAAGIHVSHSPPLARSQTNLATSRALGRLSEG